jgi:hypothetical protein
MGASGWDYVTEYKGDLAASLAALHASVFASETYFKEELADCGLPVPATLEELWTEPYWEFMGENGTHTILDISSMEQISPLRPGETAQTFGTDRPTRADWDRVAPPHGGGVWHLVGERWTGRCVLLYRDGEPTEVAFWGASGD